MEVDNVPISHLGSQASPVPVVQDLPEAQGHGSLFPTDLPKSKAFYRQLPCTHTSIRAMKTPCFEGRSWRYSLEPPCSVHTRSTEHTQSLGMPQPFACRNFHPQVPKSAGTSLPRRKLPHSSQGLQTRAAKEVKKNHRSVGVCILIVSSKSKHMEMAHKVYRFRMKNLQLAVLGCTSIVLQHREEPSIAGVCPTREFVLHHVHPCSTRWGIDAMPLCPSRGKNLPHHPQYLPTPQANE